MKNVSNKEKPDFTKSKVIIEIVFIFSGDLKVICGDNESSGHYPEDI